MEDEAAERDRRANFEGLMTWAAELSVASPGTTAICLSECASLGVGGGGSKAGRRACDEWVCGVVWHNYEGVGRARPTRLIADCSPALQP